MSQLYEKYLTEIKDENGKLVNLEPHYDDSFNFAYDVLDVIAEETPDKRALVYKSIQGDVAEFTFGQISAMSNQMANAFGADGIKKGDSVMLMMKRRYEYWIAIMALHKLGAVTIPTSHMVSSDDIKERMIKASVKAIVCVNVDDVCNNIEQAVSEVDSKVIKYIVAGKRDGYVDIMEEIKSQSKTFERVQTHVRDNMLYYFTSGTAGEPKAVIHDFSYPIAHIMTAKYWHGVKEDGLHFTISDTGWAKSAWGKLYGQWFCKCAIMVYDFDNYFANEILAIIEEEKVTSFCAPPTSYKYLVREDMSKYDLSSLEQATTAGEPMPTEVSAKFTEMTGITIREGFGQTETTLQTCTMVGDKQKAGSIGMASPQYRMLIVDENNQEVPVGETGEIILLPGKDGEIPIGVFRGYLDTPELYKDVWDGGVYHTRDKAYKDEDGYYYFVGRNDDVIKSSGYRIGPSEVEDVLMKHPAVFECAVTAYPSKNRGSIVKATIILNEGYEETTHLKTELQDFVKANTAFYKYPRKIEFVDKLPRTVTGKISRKQIRDNDLAKRNHQ